MISKKKCFNHPSIDALATCYYCGRYQCSLCLDSRKDYYYCINGDDCLAYQGKDVITDLESDSNVYLEKANTLLQTAKINAISLYGSMFNKYPELQSVAESDLLDFWDYLITIASVGNAFMEIVDSVPEKDQRGICNAIKKVMEDWQKEAYIAMVDFTNFSSKLVDSGIEVPDAIGAWVCANFKEHKQANQELKELASSLKLVRPIGLSILVSFHKWWV